MTPTEYRKARAGLRVRSLRPFRNGLGNMPEGTTFTVLGKRSGFDLLADPCDCCGFQFRIRKIDPRDVEVIT